MPAHGAVMQSRNDTMLHSLVVAKPDPSFVLDDATAKSIMWSGLGRNSQLLQQLR